MHLRYDEDLVEAAVSQCAASRRRLVPALQIARYHRERERLYGILDPDDRNAAFFKLHLDWFREWALDRPLVEALGEFKLLPKSLDLLAVRRSRGKNDEGAELYVNSEGTRTGVIALRAERLLGDPGLDAFLRLELMHLQDMVDPAFGYKPELPLPAVSVSQHRLARERYRLLWNVAIEGRLAAAGKSTLSTREQHWANFIRAFPFWAPDKQQMIFDQLWTTPRASHEMLAGLVSDPRELRTVSGPKPGAPCPLCGFPTFGWARPEQLEATLSEMIQSDFPHWRPEDGACDRCLEMYRVKSLQPV